MKVTDMSIWELLEFDSESNLNRCINLCSFTLDSTAFGILRKYLIGNLRIITARTLITQFGLFHSWGMPEATKDHFRWDSDNDMLSYSSSLPADTSSYPKSFLKITRHKVLKNINQISTILNGGL